jgi:hypothetical protein
MLSMKNNYSIFDISVIALFLAFFALISYALLSKSHADSKRKKNFSKTFGTIIKISGGGKIPKYYEYSFEVAGSKQKGTACCVHTYSKNLIGKPIGIVFETTDITNHEGLLTNHDFQEYGLAMPDSIYYMYVLDNYPVR